MANNEKKLKETKGMFKVVGTVVGLEKEYAFDEDVREEGRHEGRKFRKLNFGIKTSDSNQIRVSMFAYEPEEVFMWNSQLRKEEGENYKGTRVDYDTWKENFEEYRNEGYTVMQSRVGLEKDESGKTVTHGYPSFISAKMLYDKLTNGDTVKVEGKIAYSASVKDGKTKLYKNYNVEDVRYWDMNEDEEVSYFEQEMVFVSADEDEENNKLHITGRVIDFKEDYVDANFVVNMLDDEGEVDEDLKGMAEAIQEELEFGDTLKVFGDLLNKKVTKEPTESEQDMVNNMLGGKSKPKHAQKLDDYINEMRVNGVEEYTKEVYSDEDFAKKKLVEKKDKKDSKSKMSGKKNKKSPFEDDGIDVTNDDLPF